MLMSSLTNSELLRVVADKRVHSPVIDELCKRLEQATANDDLADAKHDAECPVCAATLHVAYDADNNAFTAEAP